MKKITEQAIQAFYNREPFKQGNTEVKTYNRSTNLYLYDNHIAELEHEEGEEPILRISNAGWANNTTKERLNGLDGVSIQQKQGIWYLNGNEWDGDWIEIA